MGLNTSLFIRDYLEQYNEANPYEIYQAYRETIKQDPYVTREPSYQNIRNYIYWLHKLGLIKRTRKEKSKNPKFQDKQFYALVDGKLTDDGWNDPRVSLYGERTSNQQL